MTIIIDGFIRYMLDVYWIDSRGKVYISYNTGPAILKTFEVQPTCEACHRWRWRGM